MKTNEFHSLIEKYLSGNTTAEENATLRSYMEEGDAARAFDEYASQKWQNAGTEMPAGQKDRIRKKLLSGIKAQRRPQFPRILRWTAAAAIIAVALTTGYFAGKGPEAQVNVFECIAANGQKSTVTLPDGTKVMLNSGSSLRYASDYNVKNRGIELNGEAYFEVARNEEIPFIVSAKQMKVEVLGTKFNVRAYSSEPEIVATLVEGSVKAIADGKEMIIKPAEEVRYDRRNGEMRKLEAPNRSHLIPWRDNELFFNNNSLKEISVILERMYNVNIIFEDDSITEYTYTGLVRNSSLSNVLDLITATTPVEAQMYYNTIKFSKRQK